MEVGAAAVGSQGEEVESFAAGVVEERLKGVVAHKGVEGDGVCSKMFEAGDGVASLSFADVGAFDVQYDWDVSGDASYGSF